MYFTIDEYKQPEGTFHQLPTSSRQVPSLWKCPNLESTTSQSKGSDDSRRSWERPPKALRHRVGRKLPVVSQPPRVFIFDRSASIIFISIMTISVFRCRPYLESYVFTGLL